MQERQHFTHYLNSYWVCLSVSQSGQPETLDKFCFLLERWKRAPFFLKPLELTLIMKWRKVIFCRKVLALALFVISKIIATKVKVSWSPGLGSVMTFSNRNQASTPSSLPASQTRLRSDKKCPTETSRSSSSTSAGRWSTSLMPDSRLRWWRKIEPTRYWCLTEFCWGWDWNCVIRSWMISCPRCSTDGS